MRILIYAFLGVLVFTACTEIPTGAISKNRTWVYVELEVVTTSDTSNYYYYGQMKQDLLESFDKVEETKGLFTLTNVRYYDNNDVIIPYADETDKGLLIFRLKDILKIEVLKEDPMNINLVSEPSSSD